MSNPAMRPGTVWGPHTTEKEANLGQKQTNKWKYKIGRKMNQSESKEEPKSWVWKRQSPEMAGR